MTYDPSKLNSPSSSFVLPKDLPSLPLDDLFNHKDAIEAELSSLSNILKLNNADMNTSLLTFDGFPRSDIDVAQIRTTRARIVHLKNDYAQLMEIIEKKMHEHFARIKEEEAKNGASSSPTTTTLKPTTTTTTAEKASSSSPPPTTLPTLTAPPPSETTLSPPFARVNSITPNSPASTAGLLPNDLIRLFGDVNWMNHDNLRGLATVVNANKNRPVRVRVLRGEEEEEEVELELVPREDWGGRGLLGCHIVPL